MSICKINSNIKVMIKNKIIKVLTRIKINNIKEILIKILLNKMEDPKNIINGANTNKIIITKSFKKNFGISLILIIIITIDRFSVNKEFGIIYIDFIKR